MEDSELKTCKYCGSLYIPQKKGIHNWKNLFKFDWSDLFYLFLIIMIIFSVYSYKSDINKCQTFISEQQNFSLQIEKAYAKTYQEQMERQINSDLKFNLENINITS